MHFPPVQVGVGGSSQKGAGLMVREGDLFKNELERGVVHNTILNICKYFFVDGKESNLLL